MPAIHPFQAVQYNHGKGDVSDLIAPPYDVLDLSQKQSLLDKNPDNIVAVDLPHVPAKELGPEASYQASADKLKAMIESGTMAKSDKPAIYAYRQTFAFQGEEYQRCGMVVNVETVPFGNREGGGILAHEQTFGGPKEDRMALMKATQSQTSPIFGLHPDENGQAVGIIHGVMDKNDPSMTADMGDGIQQEIWKIDDPETIGAYQRAMEGEDIFVADGHHRYNTALNYLESLGDVSEDHPARKTMYVLVSMSDPGLAIGPTHRVLGGMEDYSIESFIKAFSTSRRLITTRTPSRRRWLRSQIVSTHPTYSASTTTKPGSASALGLRSMIRLMRSFLISRRHGARSMSRSFST